jgi:hypothetical protein
LLFLVHCDRPFVGPVYEVILALVRVVRNGPRAEVRRVCPRELPTGAFIQKQTWSRCVLISAGALLRMSAFRSGSEATPELQSANSDLGPILTTIV